MAQDSEDSAGEKQKLEMPSIDEIDTPEFDSKLEKLKEYSEVVKAFQRFKEPKSQLQNPLSEVTRKERKGLLASTLLAFVIAILNIKPDEITAIGFKFDIENIESFYIV